MDNFDIQHYCRKESTMSEAIGEDVDCTNTCSIVNGMLISADECEQECALDNDNGFLKT